MSLFRFHFKDKNVCPTDRQWGEFSQYFDRVFNNLPAKSKGCFKHFHNIPLAIRARSGFGAITKSSDMNRAGLICFNGCLHSGNSADPFMFPQHSSLGDRSCDTEGRPYMFLVMATLILADNFMPDIYQIEADYEPEDAWPVVIQYLVEILRLPLFLPATVCRGKKMLYSPSARNKNVWQSLVDTDELSFYF